jgi:hypothetical protein
LPSDPVIGRFGPGRRLPARPGSRPSPFTAPGEITGGEITDGEVTDGEVTDGDAGKEGVGADAVGRGGRIGPGDTGGMSGTSIVSVRPSASSFDPAVSAASVGTDANPTRSATMSTYRRVGPENPVSARYTPPRVLRMTLNGGLNLSSGSSDTPVPPLSNDQH